jgi:hypothetical protein
MWIELLPKGYQGGMPMRCIMSAVFADEATVTYGLPQAYAVFVYKGDEDAEDFDPHKLDPAQQRKFANQIVMHPDSESVVWVSAESEFGTGYAELISEDPTLAEEEDFSAQPLKFAA